MNHLVLCLFVAIGIFLGSVATMYAARLLPDSHLGADARDVLKLAMALIATLVALVLGLMVATAKGTFDVEIASVRQLSANILLLDRILGEYGPETQPARALLRQGAEQTLHHLWPEDGSAPKTLAPGEAHAAMQAVMKQINDLSPQDPTQAYLKAQALRTFGDLAQTRFQMYVQGGSGLPMPFFLVVAFWLFILFGGYGLIAARNPTVLVSLLVCTLSVAAALFLIQELADPFDGLVRVSSEPMRQVIAILGR